MKNLEKIRKQKLKNKIAFLNSVGIQGPGGHWPGSDRAPSVPSPGPYTHTHTGLTNAVWRALQFSYREHNLQKIYSQANKDNPRGCNLPPTSYLVLAFHIAEKLPKNTQRTIM